jgi:N-acetylglutamate synthase-like GNAT family acetyltransferase
VVCGTYFGVWDEDSLVAAGGWTSAGPKGEAGQASVANIRHVVTDHTKTRRGYGGHLMRQVFADAASVGVTRFDCLSTLTAEPFYAAMGFTALGPISIELRPGIHFPAIRMQRP